MTVQEKTNRFIEKAVHTHGNRYTYKHTIYVKAHSKVRIVCSTHGEFNQTPSSHLRGRGCPQCGGTHKKTTEEFISEAHGRHGYQYDYGEVVS